MNSKNFVNEDQAIMIYLKNPKGTIEKKGKIYENSLELIVARIAYKLPPAIYT